MSEVAVQKEILDTLTGLKEEVSYIKQKMHYMIEFMEDTRLTEEEQRLVDKTILKIRSGDKSALISHAALKKEIGL